MKDIKNFIINEDENINEDESMDTAVKQLKRYGVPDDIIDEFKTDITNLYKPITGWTLVGVIGKIYQNLNKNK